MRVTFHIVLLLLLGVMTLGGVGASWDTPSTPTARAEPPPAASAAENPAGPVLASSGGGSPPLTVPGTPSVFAGGPSSVAPTAPPVRERQWVQNFRPADLYESADPTAPSVGQAPQFSTFELLEQSETGRSKLFDPGRGQGRLPGEVWASLADFGPSGPPRYEYTFAKGGETDPTTGRRGPDRIAGGWPTAPTAESAIVVDGDSGVVLYSKSPRVRLAPASLTKMMTAIVALENGRLDDRVTVDVDSNRLYQTTESTVMGLMPGQTVTVETLLYGLMLSSGNDAAIALAKHIGGSEQRFVEMMNQKARALGLKDTQFKNPHGLDADGHFSSAADLASIARYGMQSPKFHDLSASRHWNADGFDLWNLNKFLAVYPGADGVKPGFTDNAGRCLVGSAVRDNHRVIVAVLRSQDPTADSKDLFDYTFQSFRWPS